MKQEPCRLLSDSKRPVKLPRRDAVSIASKEGLEPSEEPKAMFRRYVDGQLTSDELDRAFDQFLDRKYGPVRVPRNECS